MAWTREMAESVINHLLRNTALTSPTTVYLAFHADGGSVPADPGTTDQNCFDNELTYTSYERQAITLGAPDTGDDNVDSANTNSMTFPEVDDGDGPFEITGLSIWTAQRGVDLGSSGECILHGPVTAVKEFDDGDAPISPAGVITVTLPAADS